MRQRIFLNGKMQIFLPDLQRQHIVQLFKKFLHQDLRRSQHKLTALNFGNIKNIVDQGQQAFSRCHRFIQTLRHILRILHMTFRDRHHAKYGVHRRADIV